MARMIRCEKCNQEIKPKQIVYRELVLPQFGYSTRRVCKSCLDKWQLDRMFVHVCPGCGLKEAWPKRPKPPDRYCSWLCKRESMARQQRSELKCEGCGGPVEAKRADARWCSPACKQKAYRARAKAKGEAP